MVWALSELKRMQRSQLTLLNRDDLTESILAAPDPPKERISPITDGEAERTLARDMK